MLAVRMLGSATCNLPCIQAPLRCMAADDWAPTLTRIRVRRAVTVSPCWRRHHPRCGRAPGSRVLLPSGRLLGAIVSGQRWRLWLLRRRPGPTAMAAAIGAIPRGIWLPHPLAACGMRASRTGQVKERRNRRPSASKAYGSLGNVHCFLGEEECACSMLGCKTSAGQTHRACTRSKRLDGARKGAEQPGEVVGFMAGVRASCRLLVLVGTACKPRPPLCGTRLRAWAGAAVGIRQAAGAMKGHPHQAWSWQCGQGRGPGRRGWPGTSPPPVG